MRLFRLSVLAVSAASLSGCYTYAPVTAPTSASVAPGTDVRIRVSAAAAERIAPLLGSDERVLSGTLISGDSAGFVVEVPLVTPSPTAGATQTLHQRLLIGRGDLLEMETRKLDRGRTALIIGASAVVVGSTAAAALKSGPGKESFPQPSGSELRLPLWRLWF